MRRALTAALLLTGLLAGCADDEAEAEDRAAASCAALVGGDFEKAADLADEAADLDDKWQPLADALETMSGEFDDEETAEAIVAAADECATVDRPMLGP